jgi:hypothetical protein
MNKGVETRSLRILLHFVGSAEYPSLIVEEGEKAVRG